MPVGQAQNNSSCDLQEIPVSMENVRPEGTEDQSATSPSGEALGKNIRLVPAQDVHFFYTRSHLSALKTVRYFYQPIFSSFSYLKNALHNLVIELCSALFFSKIIYSYILTSRTVL